MLKIRDKYIFLKKRALSNLECGEIINYIDSSDLTKRENIYYSKPCSIYNTPHQFLVKCLRACIKMYVKKHPFLSEVCDPWKIDEYYNLQKYYPGMSYSGEHMENGKSNFDSKRLLAWMIYLNDVKDGGQTYWPQQKFKANPRAGNLLIWPSGWTHRPLWNCFK